MFAQAEEVFQVEPVLSFPGLRFRGKDTVFDDVTVLAKSLEVNSSALITTLDMLISLRDDPPAIWAEEIEEHYASVGPKIKKRLEGWMNSMDGVYQGRQEHAFENAVPVSNNSIYVPCRKSE